MLKFLQRSGKDERGGENDGKGMVSDIEGVRGLGGREMSNSMRDGICICVAVVVVVALMVAVGVVVLMVVVGVVVLVIVVRIWCTGVVGVVGVLCIGVVEVNCTGVVDILVLGGVSWWRWWKEWNWWWGGCVVRLVLWCANERGYFLCRFSLKLVEMKGLSGGGCLFGMVIWADCFFLLERGFLGKMVGVDVLMDVVVEVVVVEVVDMVQAGFFVFFRRGSFGDVMGVRVVMEVGVGAVVLV